MVYKILLRRACKQNRRWPPPVGGFFSFQERESNAPVHKSDRKKQFNIWVRPAIADELREIAKREGRTLSGLVGIIFADALAKRENRATA